MPLPHSLTMDSLWPRLQFWVGGMLPGDAEKAAQGDQVCQVSWVGDPPSKPRLHSETFSAVTSTPQAGGSQSP